MNFWKTAGAILGGAAVLALGLGAAALAGDHPPGGGHDPVTICHKPGTPAEQTLVVDDNSTQLEGHLDHGDTIGPCQTETTPTDTTPTETTPTETTPTETTPTTPAGPRCPPGMVPTAGKDGQSGNDECEFPKTPPTTPAATTTTPAPPPAVTTPTPPPATETTTTPPATKPPAAKPPKAKPAPKPAPKPKNPPAKKKKAKGEHVCKTIVYTDSNGKVWKTPRTWVDGKGCVGKVEGSG